MKPILLVLTLTGCAVAARPYVQLVIDGDATFATDVLTGANAWQRLAYIAGTDVIRTRSTLLVHVNRVVGLQDRPGGDGRLIGYATMDTNLIELDASLTADHLQQIMTHELGHLLFGTAHLTLPNQRGIMYWFAQWGITTPTFDDYALVCHEAGVCL